MEMRLQASLVCCLLCLTYFCEAHQIQLRRRTTHTHVRPGTEGLARRTIDSDLLFSSSSILAPLQVGTPAQNLFVLLDTSSSDLAVFGADYASQFSNGNSGTPDVSTVAFDSSRSSTFNATGHSFQNNYGSGSSSATYFKADYAYDTIAFRGLRLVNQPLGVMHSGNVSYGQTASGILGLAFEAASLGLHATPPLQQLVFDKALKSPMFSFALMRPSADAEQSATYGKDTEPGGIFTLGFLDGDQYQGAVGWSDLVTTIQRSQAPYKWLAALDSITVNGVVVSDSQKLIANFDTGSSVSRASTQLLDAIVSQSQTVWKDNDGSYYVPCGESIAPALNLSISLGGVTVAIEPMDLLYKNVQFSSDDGQMYCYSTLTSTDSDEYDIQIGDDIMRSLFVAFSFNPPRIGIAEQSNNVQNQGAVPTFAFTSTRSIGYETLIRPQATGFSKVRYESVPAASAISHITEEASTAIASGGSYVPTATPTMQTLRPSVTPTQIGTVDSQSVSNTDALQGIERNPSTVTGDVSVIQATKSSAAPALHLTDSLRLLAFVLLGAGVFLTGQ